MGIRSTNITRSFSSDFYRSGTDAAINPAVQNYWYALLNGTSNNSEVGYGIDTDSSDDVYVTGLSASTDGNGQDFLVAKYNPSGVLQWQRTIGGTSSDSGWGIAVDSSDNFYVSGQTSSSGAGNIDVLLIKYNASGTVLWQRTLGHANNDRAKSVAVDSLDNVYVTGDTTVTGNTEIFIAKYNSSGSIIWQRTLGGTDGSGNNNTFPHEIAIDGSDNVYVFGYTNVFGGSGNEDFLVAKYNSAGVLQWQRILGDTDQDEAYGGAVDSSGNAYICGYKSSGSTNGMIVAKYDTSGNIRWQRELATTNKSTLGYAVTVDDSGNVYAGGHTEAAPSYTNHGFLIAKYNTSGEIQWQRTFGSNTFERLEAITTDKFGNIYATGLSNSGDNAVLVLKLPADGSLTNTYGSFVYEASTLGESASTLTDSVSTLTDAVSTLTDAASSFTHSVNYLTSSTTSIG